MRVDETLAQLRAAADALAEDHPDLAADDRAWIDTLDGLTDALDLAEYLAERVLHLSAMEDAAAERAKVLHARARRFGAEQERIKGVILAIVETAGGKKIVRPSVTISPRATLPKLVEIDATQTPATMLRQPPPEPDKTAIKDALKRGESVPGWALSNGGKTVALLTR
jgi:hypothetical protein